MATDTTNGSDREAYGRALIGAMAEVLEPVPDGLRAQFLETADYWLSVGLALGLEHPKRARGLFTLIEAEEAERAALVEDGLAFVEDLVE